MVVATRQGREKPGKMKQKKVQGVRTSGKTNNTPGYPNLHRAGPGGEKTEKEEPKRWGSLSLNPARWGALLFVSLGRPALMPQRWIFLLSSK